MSIISWRRVTSFVAASALTATAACSTNPPTTDVADAEAGTTYANRPRQTQPHRDTFSVFNSGEMSGRYRSCWG